MMFIQTAERVSQNDPSDNYVFQRSLLAYVEAAKLVSDDVLELGTGSGYGVEIIAPKSKRFVTVDKHKTEAVINMDKKISGQVEFLKMRVPPFTNIPDNSFDYVITFQVIEHIKKDKDFVNEIYRVLKNDGELIVTTPNRKMSLSRNPWHIREYTVCELESLLLSRFQRVDKMGVYGGKEAKKYYEENKESVKKITRFDFFNLQYNLPRFLLQIPYDILNRVNRKKLLKNDNVKTGNLSLEDFYLDKANDECLDLFFVARKEQT